jgi:hypothetical protein
MEAWQLLQGNIPSVMGGGATGNSSPAQFAEEVKQTPNKIIPNAMAFFSFFMFGCIKGGIKINFSN